MKKPSIKSIFYNANIQLLVFLILFLNVKFIVKVIAIVLMIVSTRHLKFGLSWKNSRLPLFYLLIILLEFVKYVLVVHNYSLDYSLVFSMGILQWAFCLLSIHYLKIQIDQDHTEKTHSTIKAFFLLNFLVSLFFLAILIFHPTWLTFWGHGANVTFDDPSAGDTILGISFDTSTVNATINCLGLIYFLFKKDYVFCLVSLLTVVLCTSNVTLFLILTVLALMVLTVREKKLRIYTVICTLVFLLLYFLIYPKNRTYIRNYFVQMYVVNVNPKSQQTSDSEVILLKQGDSVITEKRAISIYPDSVYDFNDKKLEHVVGNFMSFRALRKNDKGYIVIPTVIYDTKPGKFISFIQTYYYVTSSFKHFLFGAGIGNFSSKLAFRASGVRALGTYPKKFKYTSADFEFNHLMTYLYYYHADASRHSVVNYPFSVYNQVAGEYGFLGTILFVIFYLGYFLSKYHRLTYGRYLIIILLGFFLMEYWFESLSLIVIFELFMLLNIKEGRKTSNDTYMDTA